ncbi:hypothetical protein AX769_14870 [Frondihabitans sp. PAMC 28766]|uniref:hypothetical protein n=1 Tax=Frondihabitans sp. PAMC 28766 TaxID=1795630 RepID=UPI00078DB190|nr:hypothetical protein [Frondihabitans sp. PAMC 28766]AMM21182.1 hypothetical protein AX769_14870 [Frondihabitans sp. PAMC 28766]
MGSFVNPVVRPMMQGKARAILRSGFPVSPLHSTEGSATVSTPGHNPDRVLLVGNGALSGWGVASQDDAIPGHLARELSYRTARAVEVDLVVDLAARLATAESLLEGIDLHAYDAVVVVVGVSDALQLLPAREWAAAFSAFTRALVAGVSSVVDVVFMGIQPPSTVPFLNLPIGGRVDHVAKDLNAVTRSLCSDRVRYLEPPRLERIGPSAPGPADPAEMERVSAGYMSWAVAQADLLARLRAENVAWSR